jgi:uncharacterized protein HemX
MVAQLDRVGLGAGFGSRGGSVPARAAILAAAVLALMCAPSAAQQQDRERAQMMQMQQQMQRLQSDNAALQKDQSALKQQLQDAETTKKASEQKSKDLARARAQADAQQRKIEDLQQQVNARDAVIEQWKKAVAERDAALRDAAEGKRKLDAEAALLTTRLKAQTARADLCQVKHAQAVQVGGDVIDRYEQHRLRLCEPVTGIWKVSNEEEIRRFRDRLYEARLDAAPAAAASK